MWTTAPHMEHNLSRVVIAGIAADGRSNDGRRSDFADGATSLVQSLVKLSSLDRGFLTQGYAVETAYLAVLGSMALGGENSSSELIPDLWRRVARRLLDGAKERMHEVEMLESLLLVGVYEARSSRATAPHMREALEEALALTTAIEDDFHRRRRARAWRAAGRAALAVATDPWPRRSQRPLPVTYGTCVVRWRGMRSGTWTAGRSSSPRGRCSCRGPACRTPTGGPRRSRPSTTCYGSTRTGVGDGRDQGIQRNLLNRTRDLGPISRYAKESQPVRRWRGHAAAHRGQRRRGRVPRALPPRCFLRKPRPATRQQGDPSHPTGEACRGVYLVWTSS